MSGAIDDEQRDELRALYGEVDAAVARAGPTCALSGRCCRFREYGHTLFLTGVEFRLLQADAPDPVRPPDDGATCPWQDLDGRCTARDARPLGCRIYYCDPGYADAMGPLTEGALARLRAFVRRRGLAWDYLSLHEHLARAGRAPG
jgi:hypothetical protein